MKKKTGYLLVAAMVFALTACGSKAGNDAAQAQAEAQAAAQAAAEAAAEAADNAAAQAQAITDSVTAALENTQASVEEATGAAADAVAAPSGGISAEGGTITLSKADVAVVINGNSVSMPFNLRELEAAGVPSDEYRSTIELNAGDFYSVNLYLDENEDYTLIPAYFNGGDAAVSIMDAEAEEITMTTYKDEPEDQGVSILGITYGMPRSEVVAMLGAP
ncbi:MAG: hypothetical protein IKS07_05875, partial [Lachnospiraceae bacterium]|nr:hypothetical protein [Lachnospiraceae bacterium]